MSILWVIIVGFVVGLLARAVMPGRNQAGFILTTVLGIIGAVVGTYAGQAMGLYARGEPAGLIMSVLGALIVLFLFKAIDRPSTVA